MESLGAELTQLEVSVSRLLGHRAIFALLLSFTFQGCSKPQPVIEAQKPQGSADDHTTLPQSTPEKKNINSLPEGTLPEFKKNFFLKEHDLELIWIDRGSFQMGSEHPNAPENEKPLTLSTLSRGYWLAKLETRQDLYAKLTEENPSLTQGAKLPVENLTYLDAVSFCEKLTHYEAEMGRLPKKYIYQLPTEAQWEFAAKGGRNRLPKDGPTREECVWHKGNSGQSVQVTGLKSATVPGLHDILGNVYEFCHGFYAPYPGRHVVDWTGYSTTRLRVARGGSWFNPASDCTPTIRYPLPVTGKIGMVGFRIALVYDTAGG